MTIHHTDRAGTLLLRSTPTTTPTTGAAVAPADIGTRALVDRDGKPLDLRAAAEDAAGRFEGYAVLWDTVDSYGTTFAPGCFSAGGLDGDLYALLAMHDPFQPIGTFTAAEDGTGLYIKGGWDDDPAGQSWRAKAKGSAPELSVGFRAIMVDPDDENRFTQTRLVEVSQITRRMAAVPGAGFAAARGVPLDGAAAGRRAQDDAENARRLAVARARLELSRS